MEILTNGAGTAEWLQISKELTLDACLTVSWLSELTQGRAAKEVIVGGNNKDYISEIVGKRAAALRELAKY